MSGLILVEEALAAVLRHAPRGAVETVPLADAAGRVLAADVTADRPYPPFVKSRVDGYAVRAADAAAGPLPVLFEVPAGVDPGRELPPGAAARVFTGAPLPAGADAMAMQERCTVTEVDGVPHVTIEPDAPSANLLVEAGVECAGGAVVARAGDVVTPAVMGVLATVGADPVSVVTRPRVHIVATGTELVEVTATPGPAQIRNSNARALAAAAAALGGDVVGVDRVEDTPEAHREVLGRALDGADLVLVSGGVSVGDYDLVPAAFDDLGVTRVFHGVRLQPGKPIWFGVRDGTLAFGLPGNPVSSLVNLELFVRPALRRRAGQAPEVEPSFPAVVTHDLAKGVWRRKYLPARWEHGEGGLPTVELVPYRGSGDLFGLARANGLLVVPIDAPPRPAGSRVDVVPLRTVATVGA